MEWLKSVPFGTHYLILNYVLCLSIFQDKRLWLITGETPELLRCNYHNLKGLNVDKYRTTGSEYFVCQGALGIECVRFFGDI